jgi:hypothetical protein
MIRESRQRIGIGVALVLVVGAALYFGGRWHERNLAAGARAERIGQVEAAQVDLVRAQAELARAEDRIRLLRARSLLFETAVDLDRRNFGTANQHLSAAAEELKAVREGGPEMDMQGLQTLQRDVEGMNLNVATDLQVQRAQVLDLLARLDALFPEERSGPARQQRSGPEATDPTSGGS